MNIKHIQKVTPVLFLLFMIGIRLSSAEPTQKPNLILIVCDDLNDDVFGAPSYPTAKIPHINRLMKMGVRFALNPDF